MVELGPLPKEVVEEIMSWLPADSLLSFKLINKSWHGLICSLVTDPDFIARHLCNAKKIWARVPTLGLRPEGGEAAETPGFTRLTLLNEAGNEELKLPLSPEEIEHGYGEVGNEEVYHCDGIILRVISGEIVILCNPVLREFEVFKGPGYDNRFLDYGPICGGFGYDPTTDAYKIVRVYYNQSSGITRAKVHTLGMIFWREVRFPQDAGNVDEDVLCVIGACYWVAGSSDKILYFDLASEKFCLLPAPDRMKNPGAVGWLRLAEWNERIACLDVSVKNVESRVQVFIMEAVSEGSCSWTKHLDISLDIGIESVLKFWKNDELLFLDCSMGFVSYNLVTEKLRYFSVDGIGQVKLETCRFWPLLFVKSLVSISGRSTEDEDSMWDEIADQFFSVNPYFSVSG